MRGLVLVGLRIAGLLLAGAVAVFGAYSYDTMPDPTVNGTATVNQVYFPSGWVMQLGFPGAGGSQIYPSVPFLNPNDYEISTTVAIQAPYGGTFIHFLRADTDGVQAGSGSYISVELQIPSNFRNPGMATLVVNQCVAGVVTQMAATSVTAMDGMRLRSVVFGTNLWVFTDYGPALQITIPIATGLPGVGGYGLAAGGFPTSKIRVGHHDTTPPLQVVAQTVGSSVQDQNVSLQWQGVADDVNGIGVMEYLVSRGGALMYSAAGAAFADSTVLPGMPYTYAIQAVDFHGNVGPATSITVTTPSAGQIDPRRSGIVAGGSYWGGGGEQIDMLGGNLNFSLPLFTAQGRTGWQVPVGLAYNSQMWRRDGGQDWQLAGDVGFGLGWRMLVGSITPYYVNWTGGVDHYVYTDSTGAEYRLDVNNGGVWSSTRGVYVWFDSNAHVLHFKDGMFWVMGCISGGTEADAGTMYPTVVEDVGGNQVIITYDTGVGLPYDVGTNVQEPNTSSRIVSVEDVKTGACAAMPYQCLGGQYLYTLAYDRTHYAVPHLTAYRPVGTSFAPFTFTYTTGTAGPPFGAGGGNYGNWTGATAVFLATMPVADGAYSFSYDGSGSGEMTQVTYPWGGHLRWAHTSDGYSDGRQLRAVTGRYLAADGGGGVEWGYSITRDNASAGSMHGSATLVDASGIGAKTWNFLGPQSGGNAWKSGLAVEFVQKASAASGAAVYTDDTYAWALDPDGNPYISAKVSVTDPGTANAQTAKTTQTLDRYGNVTQSAVYPYNNSSTPLRTYNSTYLAGGYIANYLRNKLVSSTMTSGGVTTTLVTNNYTFPSYTVNGSGPYYDNLLSTAAITHEMDPSPAVSVFQRGYVVSTTMPAATYTFKVYPHGAVGTVTGTDGRTATATPSAAANYAAPGSIATATYGETLSYNPWLQMTQTTGSNGEQSLMTYDGYGRPLTATSPYGGVTNYAYAPPGVSPKWQTVTGPNGFTRTTVDGLGRTVKVERGADASHIVSVVSTEYAPCACSPLGKLKRVSVPYAPGTTPAGWTTYVYDGIGRTASVTQPDGSTTTYSYAGNQTTVTDAAGKWKRMVSDVDGNLVQVVEPDPAGSGSLTTSYSYDAFKRLTLVTMPRGSVTQTRTFVYDSAGRLTSATNPENGTVSYTYNSYNLVATKTDARGWKTVYTYDGSRRLTKVQKFQGGVEDVNQQVVYTYDSYPDGSISGGYPAGRLTTATYMVAGGTGVTESYQYTAAGKVAEKWVAPDQCISQIDANSPDPDTPSVYCAAMGALYSYGLDGQVAGYTVSSKYPFGGGYAVNYGFDGMGRPVSAAGTPAMYGQPANSQTVWAQNAQYDVAGRMTGVQTLQSYALAQAPNYFAYTTRTMGYNLNGQMVSQGWSASGVPGSSGGLTGSVSYSYTAGANNGQISQMVDSVSGETVSYAYDSLKRLVSASATGGSAPWTQTYGYDGFGNLTAKVLNGVTTGIPVDAATNRLVNAGYDAAGNMVSGVGVSLSYDGSNRIAAATPVSGGTERYWYGPDNKRVLRMAAANGTREWTLWGAYGERMGVFDDGGYGRASVWFAGMLVAENVTNGPVGGFTTAYQDRLGTDRKGGARFRPYGEEVTSTGNRFATYTKDGFSGLHYADQRFYASAYGRFATADPYMASGGPENPGSWNRYSYVQGDPGNYRDPRGLFRCIECEDSGPDPYPDPVPAPPQSGNQRNANPANLIVKNLSKAGTNYNKVTDALGRIGTSIDPDCQSFLESGGSSLQGNIADLLSNGLLAVGDFTGTIAAFTGTAGSTVAPGDAAIVVNNTGAFFKSSFTLDQGKIQGGTDKADVFILLHELAHLLSAQGFQADGPSSTNKNAGTANDRLIDQNCQKTLGLFK